MIQASKVVKSYLFYVLSALGISLTIKASVGVSSFNSMNLAFSNAFDIKVGTITMIINMIFFSNVHVYDRNETQEKVCNSDFFQSCCLVQ